MAMTATQTASTTSTRRDPRTVLPVLWVFAVLNYLYCDVLGLMHAPDLQGFLVGEVGGMSITTGFLLGAGVLMEIPIAMVLVSRLAPRRVARPANLVAGAVMTLVQLGSFGFGSDPTPHYVFFSVVEVAATVAAVVIAWGWRSESAAREGSVVGAA
jgi:MFS family permease